MTEWDEIPKDGDVVKGWHSKEKDLAVEGFFVKWNPEDGTVTIQYRDEERRTISQRFPFWEISIKSMP